MYTLRTIYREKGGWHEVGVETNTALGHSYTTIRKDRSPLQFKEEVDRNGWVSSPGSDIYAIVRNPEGELNPLYSNCDHFIMTESGKTFERI